MENAGLRASHAPLVWTKTDESGGGGLSWAHHATAPEGVRWLRGRGAHNPGIARLSRETYHELIFEELGTAHFEVDQGQDGLQLPEADAAKEGNPSSVRLEGFQQWKVWLLPPAPTSTRRPATSSE